VSLPPTLRPGPAEAALRDEVRSWLVTNRPRPLPEPHLERIRALVDWQARLAEAGFIGLSWPERHGGRGLGIAAEAVFAAELASAEVPELINRLAIYIVAPTLFEWGTPEQLERFLPGMPAVREIWCQGFSEPGAGSDLAAVTTQARVDGDRLVVHGQKVWTSRADIATWCVAVVRTDPQQLRHRGLSLVVIPMNAPGITVRPLLELNHEPHFSEVFFDEVEVPLGNVVGRLNEGWAVAMSMLGYERGLFALERQIRLQNRLGRLVEAFSDGRRGDLDEGAVGRLYAQLAVLEAQVYQTLAAQAANTLVPGQTAVDKLLLADADQELAATCLDLLGDEVALERNDWTAALLTSRSVSIYGGSSEIQRNIIARQLLHLPAGGR
jgi:alkylation response protein AidB-like acyl-CoA dehydrogenase